ncbi:MAG: GNAT family N-acetyltransferase [Candidatus Aenigmarchaeota archaeon]|nr:GNAT family N-acetyltransferase [Candidatus Aenigmarchaeota archaeon]
MFKSGAVVRKFEVNGEKVILRYPKMSDAKNLMRHINSLIDERARIILTKKVTLEEEKKYLKGIIDKSKKGLSIDLIAEVNGEFAGKFDVFRERNPPSAIDHIAKFGLGLKRKYRNMGIGTEILKVLIEIAKKEFKAEIIELGIIADNDRAVHVYKDKMGFREVGRIPNGYKRDGKYLDRVIMIKNI